MKFKCTFTGIDETTEIAPLIRESKMYPFIEWGVLFSLTRCGREPRYPSIDFIKNFAVTISSESNSLCDISIHLCGSAVRKFLLEKPSKDYNTILRLIECFDRIQLNINATPEIFDTKELILKQVKNIGKPIILQYNENNKELLSQLDLKNNKDIHILKDNSCGRGLYADDFTIPEICSQSSIGFAGGLGPDNILETLPKIHESVISSNVEGSNVNPLFWIDMESSIRDWTDRFHMTQVIKTSYLIFRLLRSPEYSKFDYNY